VQSGHDVSLITTPNNRDEAEKLGFEYLELFNADETEHLTRVLVRATEGVSRWADERFGKLILSVPRALHDIVAAHQRPGETVLLTHEFFTLGAGSIIQAHLGVPYGSVWVSPPFYNGVNPWLPQTFRGIEDWSKNFVLAILKWLPYLKKRLANLRGELGLPPEPDFVRALFYSQRLNLCLYPEVFKSRPVRMSETIFTGFAQYDPGVELSEKLEAFLEAGEPPVVFMNASWRNSLDTFFTTSVEASRSLGVRAIRVGRDFPVELAESTDVCMVDFVPMQALLPRVRALVHHGGIGTIGSALQAGVPQLVVPFNADQPKNAETVEKLGLGIAVPDKDYVAKCRARLWGLLNSREIEANCRTRGKSLGKPADFSYTIKRLEALLA
jgi:rhamnosyltransferase subunit B